MYLSHFSVRFLLMFSCQSVIPDVSIFLFFHTFFFLQGEGAMRRS